MAEAVEVAAGLRGTGELRCSKASKWMQRSEALRECRSLSCALRLTCSTCLLVVAPEEAEEAEEVVRQSEWSVCTRTTFKARGTGRGCCCPREK